MKRILITGGAGNVGGSLARRLVQDDNNYVVVLDDLSTGNVGNLPSKERSNWKFIKADVNNLSDIMPIMVSHDFSHVFHYAAIVGVARTLEHPVKVLEDIDGFKNILSLAKNTNVERVFFSSSSEVYGEPVEIPQIEDTTPLNSRLPYAIVKNIGESYCKSYFQEFGLEYTIFRFFNTFGPLQSEDFVISRFLKQAMHGEDITIYGKGDQTRTFCYIDDNLDTIEKIMNEGHARNDVINIGHDDEMTVLELAKKVITLTNSKSKLIHLPALEEGDMTRRCPDVSKMKKILGRPLTTLDEGILKTIKYGNF